MALTDLPIHLAAARGREEFAEGWGLDSCPYPDDGPMRMAWIDAWCDAEEEDKNRIKQFILDREKQS